MTRGKSVVPNVAPSSANIFQRDRHECQYCGSKNNLTVDHVIPLDHFKRKKKIPKGITAQCWENLTTACGRCNSLKDNKTLEESGMKLRRKPFKPTPRDLIDFDLLWEKIARLQNGGTS
jgi:5-methylcytosine-specific restriction endonuclease McrA